MLTGLGQGREGEDWELDGREVVHRKRGFEDHLVRTRVGDVVMVGVSHARKNPRHVLGGEEKEEDQL